MIKFYLLHQPSDTTYDERVGWQSVSQTEYEYISQAETAIDESLKSHPNVNRSNIHICVVK